MKSPFSLRRSLFLLPMLLVPALAQAQDRGSVDFAQIDGGIPTAATESPGTPPSLPTSPSPARGLPAPTPTPGTIRLNFQNADLSAVLNYLSSTAGFIITQETPVTGTVNVVSQQPMTPDEAVDLLNTILDGKGYTAIRNGRILKIVSKQGASARELPVVKGSDPEAIPRKENMVTQILPVRYVPVGKLVDNLRPLLSSDASISSNDSSNAVILTDTQTNIHRIAEIIRALDTSVSSISVIHVYTLRYADAKSLADVVTQLFAPSASSSGNNNQQQGGRGGFQNPFFGGGRGGGGGNQQQQQAPTQPESAAMQAAARVVAVADETTNSVVVSAPDEFVSAITDIVEKLDTNSTEVTETQIFKLLHADATELAASLTTLYADSETANGASSRNNNNRGFFFGQPTGGSTQSDRALQQARVITVADARTNSVLVNASHASLVQIAMLVGRLDATDSKKQHIYIHPLTHADPSNVAYILNNMMNASGGTTTSDSSNPQPTDNRLRARSLSGLTTDAQGSLGGSSSSSSSNRSSSSGLR